MHNNISEMNLRREVVGRKNWLFVGSDDGGEVNATFVSLLASCSLQKVEPFPYMRDLLCLLPRWPSHRVIELPPATWRETLQKREAQEALEANALRRFTASHHGNDRTGRHHSRNGRKAAPRLMFCMRTV
jgi:transposase